MWWHHPSHIMAFSLQVWEEGGDVEHLLEEVAGMVALAWQLAWEEGGTASHAPVQLGYSPDRSS